LLQRLANNARYSLHGTYSGNPSFVEDWDGAAVCHKVAMDDPRAIAALMNKVRPDVVVHLAAISSPAKAESDPVRAKAINCPTALVDGLEPHASIIFLSTDQVYCGLRAPYVETAAAEPVNVYGQSKLDFERTLQAKVPGRSVSLRMSLLLGPPAPKRSFKKNSFLQDCDRMLSSNKPHDFFSDEFRSVVAVDDVLHVLQWAIDGGAKVAPGVYNMGGPAMHGHSGPSRVDVARTVAAHRGHSEANINGIPRPPPGPGGVRSPPDISMDSSKLERAAGVRFRPLSKMLSTAFP
jgi:dTDP-4-dehydrorhamnose reductase